MSKLAFELVPYHDVYHEQFIHLVRHIQQVEFGVPVTLEEQPDLLSPVTYFSGRGGHLLLCVQAGQVVGSVGILPVTDTCFCLRKMFVMKAFRGGGYGIAQQMLEGIMNWATNRGGQEIYLGTVEYLHAARRFYERNGFTPVEVADLPEGFPRMAVDTHFYRKKMI